MTRYLHIEMLKRVFSIFTYLFVLFADPAVGGSFRVKIGSQITHEVSPYVYGLNLDRRDRTHRSVWQLNPGSYRFGGNTSSRYNWKINSWNTGKDWFFANFSSRTPKKVDYFMRQNVDKAVSSLVTLPLLGWVAKDNFSASFPTKKFKNQPHSKKGAGNGVDANGKLLKADPKDCCVKINMDFIKEWVMHLKGQFGSYPHHYIIGNEPMLWWKTHRDVHPEPATYAEILEKFVEMAQVVRKTDKQAVIVGPALWGWMAMQNSSMDEKSDWNGWKRGTDRANHQNQPFLEWFLKEIVQREKKLGMSLLDVVDVHYYPEGKDLRNGRPSSNRNRNLRIAATRSLWDKSYDDKSWIDEKIYFIPRLQELARKYKPSLKVAIGEYNFRGEKDIAGGVVQAEVLGVFAYTGLYSANYWTVPPRDSYPFQAFKIFRNYDNQMSTFGREYLQNDFGIQQVASVFSAKDTSARRLTLVVINKDLKQKHSFLIDVSSHTSKPKKVNHFFFTEKLRGAINQESLAISTDLSVQVEPLSVNLFEITY